jgi:hypothetical protein
MRVILNGWIPMSRSSRSRPALALFAAALVVGACVAATPSQSAEPSVTASVSPPAASGVSSSATAPSQSVTASLSATEPPPASLAIEGGDPVTGQLGTFTWGDGGSDSPWLPGSPITVGTGERLTVTIAGPVGVATWSAKRVPEGATGGSGATGPISLGTGGPPIAFDAPETGAWSVQVTVDYHGGIGTATYYWLVTVR